MPYADTAKAAEDLAAGMLSETTAVIAPRRCARITSYNVCYTKLLRMDCQIKI